MTIEKSRWAVAPGVEVAVPVWTLDSANAMSGSVSAPAPNKVFKAVDVFIICFLCWLTILGALRWDGSADPPSGRPPAPLPLAILGVLPNGTLNQVAVQLLQSQVLTATADIPWLLCGSSHGRCGRSNREATVGAALRAEGAPLQRPSGHRDGAVHP